MYLIINGSKAFIMANQMPESAGLGSYAYLMGGLIQIGISLIIIAVSILLLKK